MEISRRRPQVLFVDSLSWECAAALAGALRSNGVAVARVTTPPGNLKTRLLQDLERLIYGPTHRLPCLGARPADVASVAPPEARDRRPQLRDLQIQDELRPLVAAGCAAEFVGSAAPATLGPGIDAAVLYDKRCLARTAAAAAVPVPRVWDRESCRSFPAVVKVPVGSAGVGVRTVRSRRELEEAWEEVGRSGAGQPFVQAWHPAESRSAGVAYRGALRVSVEYRSRPPVDNPNGAPVAAEIIDDLAVRELTARFVKHIGFTGMFCLDWVRDEQGGPMLIDFNPRSFGSWPVMQELGVDFIGAYLANLGIGPGPATGPVRHGVPAGVLLFPLPATRHWSELRRLAAADWAIVRRRRGWLGHRWAFVSRVKIIAAAGIETTALVRRRLRARGAYPGRLGVGVATET